MNLEKVFEDKLSLLESEHILIIGASGNLGNSFTRILANRVKITDISRSEIPTINSNDIYNLLAKYKPTIIINCAAHTNAELGEVDHKSSFLVNSILPQFIAIACRKLNIRFVHFSSTGVYGDWKSVPYTEFDNVKPTTVHHNSKYQGEKLVLLALSCSLIIRTGWLFGGTGNHNKTFVLDRINEAKNTTSLFSDSSQRGNPTYINDLVKQVIIMIGCDLEGVFNCVGSGTARRLDYVTDIINYANLNCTVTAAPEGSFNRIAPVSSNETAENYKLELLNLNFMPKWQDSLKKYIENLEF